jgi:glycosyltransferase involved in cell wall biosynthesis
MGSKKMSKQGYNVGMASAYFALMKGGGEHYTLYLSNALSRMGHKVSIICGKQPICEPQPLSNDFPINYIPQLFFLRDLGAKQIPYLSFLGFSLHNLQYQLSLEHHLDKKHNYDIIHTHDPASLHAAIKIKQKYGIPVVTSIHGPPDKRVINDVKKIDAVMPINDDICQIFLKNGVKNVNCIPCAVDRVKFKNIKINDKNRPINISGRIILFVGRLMPIKNIENLIKAFKRIQTIDTTVSLVIVGDGPSKKDLISLTKKLDLEKKVLFTGAMRYEDLPSVYNMADVFVLPSLYESFSLVALEAAACGVPIVISEEAKAMIQTIGSDALFPIHPRSIDSISQGILSALECGKDCNLTDLALQRVQKLDWDQNASTVTKIYESVINP